MYRDNAFLVTAINEVSEALRAEPLRQSEAIMRAGETLNNMSGLLINNQCPPSAQAEYVLYLLRAEKFRRAYQGCSRATGGNELSRLIIRLKIIRRRLQQMEETWRFRSWGSSLSSFSVAGLLILPAYLIFLLAMWAGGTLLTGSAIMGVYLTGVTGGALWAKDGVGLYWSLYSFIPLFVLNRHFLSPLL